LSRSVLLLSSRVPDLLKKLLFCFFFQAEDGIRDATVTGVQTCALPISIEPARGKQNAPLRSSANPSGNGQPRLRDRLCLLIRQRSEERRVGKVEIPADEVARAKGQDGKGWGVVPAGEKAGSEN